MAPLLRVVVFQRIDDAGQFQRRFHVLMDHRSRLGIGVVDLDLYRRQAVAQDLIFNAGEAERARGVEPERLQVAGDQFHRCDPALADLGDERLAVGEGGLRSPQPEPHRIGEVVDVGGAGRGRVEDACARQVVLEQDAADALLRAFLLAHGALAAGDAAHLMCLVERDHAVEVGACPIEDLLRAGYGRSASSAASDR